MISKTMQMYLDALDPFLWSILNQQGYASSQFQQMLPLIDRPLIPANWLRRHRVALLRRLRPL